MVDSRGPGKSEFEPEEEPSFDAGASNFARTFFKRSADTAHDLKTPLNIAVLNLELLRMRLRKLVEGGDPKLEEYASSLELELRRMAAIFDAYFVLSAPPRNAAPPEYVDFAAVVRSQAQTSELDPRDSGEAMLVRSHEVRIRELVRLFFESTGSLFSKINEFRLEREGGSVVLLARGPLTIGEVAADKVFKFYYSGPSGNPDIRLASARLIAESYGGSVELRVTEEGSVLELKLPSGER